MKKQLPMYREAKPTPKKKASKNISKKTHPTDPIQEKDGELVVNFYLLMG